MTQISQILELMVKNSIGVLVSNFLDKLFYIAHKHGVKLSMTREEMEKSILSKKVISKLNATKIFRESKEPDFNSFKKEYKDSLESLIKNLKNLELSGKVKREEIVQVINPLLKLEVKLK